MWIVSGSEPQIRDGGDGHEIPFGIKLTSIGSALVWLATTEPDRDWESGQYYEDGEIKVGKNQAEERTVAEQLWNRNAQLLGMA